MRILQVSPRADGKTLLECQQLAIGVPNVEHDVYIQSFRREIVPILAGQGECSKIRIHTNLGLIKLASGGLQRAVAPRGGNVYKIHYCSLDICVELYLPTGKSSTLHAIKNQGRRKCIASARSVKGEGAIGPAR